jgi:hypothetical protein
MALARLTTGRIDLDPSPLELAALVKSPVLGPPITTLGEIDPECPAGDAQGFLPLGRCRGSVSLENGLETSVDGRLGPVRSRGP